MRTTSPIRIRRAIAEDAPALSALMHASAAYQGEYSAILHGYAVTPEQIARDQVFLAERGAEILGFYSLADAGGEPEVDLLFVADAAQGSGVGARLFAHMRDTAHALGIASVKIVSHPPAEAFYVRMGAARVGTAAPSGRVGWARPVLRLKV